MCDVAEVGVGLDERRTGSRPRALILLVLVAAFGAGCSAGASTRTGLAACREQPVICNEGPARDGGTVTWLVEQGWGDTWNGMRVEGASYYLDQALAGTTPVVGWFAPDGSWVWNEDLLAEEPRVTSVDPMTIVYPYREEARWNDGTPIGLDDVRFAWRHNSGREDHCDGCDPGVTTGWQDVVSVEAGDAAGEVVIIYRRGVVDPEWHVRFFPSHLPAHVAEEQGFDWTTPGGMGEASRWFASKPPTWSGGPYVVDEVDPDERVVLVPNPAWYGRHAPTLDRVVKEVITNPTDWAVAIANGELDGGAPLSISSDVADRLAATSGVEMSASAGTTTEQVLLNLASPGLADPVLRRALLTAIDVEDLQRRVLGELAVGRRTHPYLSEASAFHDDLVTPTGLGLGDLEAARRLLTDAGYGGATDGGTLHRNGATIPPLRFLHLAGHPTRGTIVELVQATLAQVGVQVEPVTLPGPRFGPALLAGEFDLVVIALTGGPTFTDLPGLYHGSDGPANYAGIAVPEVDRLVGSLAGQRDLVSAADVVDDIAERVLQEAAVLLLWDKPAVVFAREELVNVRDAPLDPLRAQYNLGDWGLARGG